MPLTMLPHFLAQIAPLWPAWHLGQLALTTTGQATTGSIGGHLLWLGLFTAVCFAIARRGLARAA
jgi:ABC-2 type transport system permease protein